MKYCSDQTFMTVKSHVQDCDLDVGNMTWVKVMAHHLSLDNNFVNEILFRSNVTVRSCGPDTNLGIVCTVTLTKDKIMTYP